MNGYGTASIFLEVGTPEFFANGRTIPGEDRSRGARFNSALRFTAERPELIVVVVSADRPVSIIQSGVELSAQCDLRPTPGGIAPSRPLTEWIDNGP